MAQAQTQSEIDKKKKKKKGSSRHTKSGDYLKSIGL
jgi:hypothetical protein